MIRKSGNRLSEKIMLHQKDRAPNRFNLKPSRSRTIRTELRRESSIASQMSLGRAAAEVKCDRALGRRREPSDRSPMEKRFAAAGVGPRMLRSAFFDRRILGGK